MPDLDREPYMIWECPHRTTLTRTHWGDNLAPVCEDCKPEDGDFIATMKYQGSIPIGCAYGWNESTVKRAVGPSG